MKDWGDYRKLFEHPSPDFERLPFAVRCMAAEILRHCDRRGRIVPTRSGQLDTKLIRDIAHHVHAHPGEEPFIHAAVDALLEAHGDDEPYLVFRGGYLVIRNFVDAQRSESADRMRRKRERDAGGSVTPSQPVTEVTSPPSRPSQPSPWSGVVGLVGSDRSGPDPEPVAQTRPETAREAPPESKPVQPSKPRSEPMPAGRIPCPADLALTPEQRATLETSLIPGHAIDALTSRFVLKAIGDPDDARTFAAWRKCLVVAVQSDWNNANIRAKVQEKPPGLVEHERRQREEHWIPPPVDHADGDEPSAPRLVAPRKARDGGGLSALGALLPKAIGGA